MERIKDLFVTILDGSYSELIINLSDYQKGTVTFGRESGNDIILQSGIVSKKHGYFYYDERGWSIHDNMSTNGLFLNNVKIDRKNLIAGDKILIGYESAENKVVMVFSNTSTRKHYNKFSLTNHKIVNIGRGNDCEIVLNHVAVFKNHCRIIFNGGKYILEKIVPEAPVQFNGAGMFSRQTLNDSDRFLIGDTQFIYMGNTLHYIKIVNGVSFEVSKLSKIVGRGKKRKKINTDVNFSVEAGEFVAIIGGSGAGKSTLLNCLSGNSKISEGSVTIAGENLSSNYASLKHLIGYVPQKDIVYDNLTLEKMLLYAARLRMPDDSSQEELELRVSESIHAVELDDKRELLIKNLSGGQKKRASIAVELLSDPKLFFLDEPTSGLDPGTERNLMFTLKSMCKQGKTVVLVTHTPINLNLCDKIVVMGTGGRLCYCGDPQNALAFFKVKNLVDIYDRINTNAKYWAEQYINSDFVTSNQITDPVHVNRNSDVKKRASSLCQFYVLIRRYTDLQLKDSRRMLIQFLMPVGLGLLLYAAFKDSYPFETSGDTQKLSLTLACCTFWMGLFGTIQEICKEQEIYRRECMANLKILPYIFSKLAVNFVFGLLQSIMLVILVYCLLGAPEVGMHWENSPVLEIFVTTYLTNCSAACIGLLVSSIVSNSDQAISIAPVLLIPQILFSGIIVDLEGIVKKISYLISCRFACVAYCTTADINNLPKAIIQTALGTEEDEVVIIDSIYSYTSNISLTAQEWFGEEFALTFTNPIVSSWMLLIVMSVIAVIAAVIVLARKNVIK